MNLIPRKLSDWFRRFFHGGLQAIAAEEAAAIQMDVLDAQAKAFQKSIEIARQTKPHRESDDELERELAAEFAATLRETALLGRAMLSPLSAEERAEVLSRPLSGSPSGSMEGLPAPSATNQETGSSDTNHAQVIVRRGPGRPKGSKTNKTKKQAS